MQAAFNGAVNTLVTATDTPDFSAVTSTGWMFSGAAAANPNTSNLDTSSVTNMAAMFYGAISFDQPIGSWNVTSLTDATNMFGATVLSNANYDNLLVGWNSQTLQSGVTFSGGNSNYCSAEAIAARASMIASDSWVITDGVQGCPPANLNDELRNIATRAEVRTGNEILIGGFVVRDDIQKCVIVQGLRGSVAVPDGVNIDTIQKQHMKVYMYLSHGIILQVTASATG